MTTDFTPEAPHTDYECTLHVRGTKEDFQNLYNLLAEAQPEDEPQHKIKEEVLDEIQELVNWIDTGEEYNGI